MAAAASTTAARVREELVGKRFLSVAAARPKPLKLSKLREWEWRAGVVRSSSHHDFHHPELTVLVEFDDKEWKKREWIRVYDESIFQIFLVEHTLSWSLRKDPHGSKSGSILWPALSFKILVDTVGLKDSRIKPLEFLVDKSCEFVDYSDLKTFEEGENVISPAHTYAEVKKAIKHWLEYQDGQRILLTTPSVLVGERVEVYRVEGTTQWYTAVIGSYNENTRELALTDDTVLEEHNEDPTLVQICLIGDGVVESILRGVNTGITPRRRTCTLNNHHWGQSHYTRTRSQSQSPSNSSTGSNSSSGHNTRALSSASAKKSRSSAVIRSTTNTTDSTTASAVSSTSPASSESEKVEKTGSLRERKRKTSTSEAVPISGDSVRISDKICGKKSKSGDKVGHETNSESRDKCSFAKNNLDAFASRNVSVNVSSAAEERILKTKVKSAKPGDLTKNQFFDAPKNSVGCSEESKGSNANSDSEKVFIDKVTPSHLSVIASNEEKLCVTNAAASVEESSEVVSHLTRERSDDFLTSSAKAADKEKAPFTSPAFDPKLDKASVISDSRSDSGISEKSVIFRSDCSRLSDERSASISSECSRLSDDPSNSRLSDDSSFQGKVQQQTEETNRVAKSSPASSPLVFNSSEPVRVWRDPKLVNSDNTVRHVHSVQHSLMAHPSSGVSHGASSPLYAGGIPVSTSVGAKIAHQPVLSQQTHGAIGVTHYPSHISPHVMAPHSAAGGSRMEPHALHISGAAPGSVPSQQNFTHLLPQHAQHLLPQYAVNIPMEVPVPWQQKYAIPVTGGSWLPVSYNDDLIDRRLERDRREQMERRDQIERRDQMEKEREKKEKELLEHERLKQRLAEQHHSQKEDQARQREAVHQHFENSLRSASKNKSSAGWNPIPIPSKCSSVPVEQHMAAVNMSGKIDGQEHERPRSLEARPSKDSGRSPGLYAGIASNEEKHRPDADKWSHAQPLPAQKYSQPQQEGSYQYIPSSEALNRSASSRIKTESPSSAHAYSYNSKPQQVPSRTVSPAYLPKVEPSFNIYGYQPFQHSFIIQDKLAEQVKPHVSSEHGGGDLSKSSHGVSPHPAHASMGSSNLRCQGLPSPPPLLPNREAEKVVCHPGKPMISPAHEQKAISPHSISPKHQQKSHHQGQESGGVIYGGSAAPGTHFKPYEFAAAQPSRSPHARGGASHHHSLSPQMEPHNLQKLYMGTQGIKSESSYALTTVSVNTTTYSSHVYTNAATTCGTSHIVTSPTTTAYGQSVMSGSAHSGGTSTHHLIQQGLVPNPIYSPSSTNITTGSVSNPVVSRPSPGLKGTQVSATHPMGGMVQGAYSKPGITSGTPIPRASPSPGCLNLQSSHCRQTSPPVAHINTASYQPLGSPNVARALPKSSHSMHHSPGEQNLMSGVRSGSLPVGLVGDPALPGQAHSPIPNHPNRKASQPSPITNHFPHVQPSSAHPLSSYSAAPVLQSSGVQMQPLNLQNPVRQQETVVSPSNLSKRKASKESNNRKRSKTDPSGPRPSSPPPINPVLARVSAPSSLVASAATAITAVMNPIAFPSTMTTTVPTSQVNSNSTAGAVSLSTAAAATNSPSMANVHSGMLGTGAPVSEPDQSVSPTSSSGSGTNPVTKLKKAWLQRHSDEDNCKKENVSSSQEPSASSNAAGNGCNARACSSPKQEEPSLPHPLVNGHKSDKDPSLYDESTSSASEPESEHPQVKRAAKSAKARGSLKEGKRQKRNSETSMDLNSNEDKQEGQNSGKEEVEPPVVKQPKKRGRKPKPKPNPEEAPKSKPYAPGEKPSIARLKRTGESFLQDVSCCDVAAKVSKCRECRMTTHQRNKKMANIFCRFYAFRRLRYSKNGILGIAGFSEPTDATEDDLKLWLAQPTDPPLDLDLETSRFLLTNVGNQFCDLIEQEKEAHSIHLAEDKTTAWKRVVQGVREMCDVCETTLFNIHWACNKCGFVVCIDCYKARKNGTMKWAQTDDDSPGKDRDKFWWLLCNNKQPHEQDKLMLTQIIADNALWEMGNLVHSVRKRWSIAMHCQCVRKNLEKENKSFPSNGICKQLMSAVNNSFTERKADSSINGLSSSVSKSNDKGGSLNGTVAHIKPEQLDNYNSSSAASPLSWLADVALNASGKLDGESSSVNKSRSKPDSEDSSKPADEGKEEHFSTLRELLVRPTTKTTNSGKSGKCTAAIRMSKDKFHTLDDVINCMIEQSVPCKEEAPCDREEMKLIHYTRRYPQARSGWEPLPVRIFTLAESKLLFPEVFHSWLCEGRLLRLHDPTGSSNLRLFQEQWKRGQPILVSSVNKALDMKLWHPESFARDFGDIKNDLVNCHNGNIVPNQPMRRFWEGFESFTKRMKDESGEYMLLKLKDWPPGDDFSEMLPGRFQDLMRALPMPEYTHRNGRLNLAGRLPDCFVRPDLGPKMYNAYGSAVYPTKGTTNLHLDISDAVNVMVYVGVPRDGDCERHIKEALRAIDDAGCDILTKKRVREKGERPGALWHIYNARDADKIRDLLNKVALERGEKLEAHHDPIHDQSWYLDSNLRQKLYSEYGVEGYAIAQCLGDAVFIPAGAPHQVRNLHSCIKVAEDFVSPENVSHCFTLTQEFRDLSDTHTNHEDKLQVKNIIYHAVKDALSVMMANGPKDAEDVS